MWSIVPTERPKISLHERILGMSDHTVHTKLPARLRQTGLFSDEEIVRMIEWLDEVRATHRLDVID